jgi:hypothetical protein
MDKQKIKEQQEKILALTRSFCTKELNEEYAQLSEKLILKLSRKRTVPFITGKPEIWAASVIHALGTINFLFDKSTNPHKSVDDINTFFGTSKSTVTSKSKQIRDLLDLWHFDKEFSTQDMKHSNPLDNLVMVDGIIVPVSSLPDEFQEMVKQVRAEGNDISFSTQQQ